MAKLSNTNKYLATEAMRKHAARVTVATSSAIDGIYAPFKQGKSAAPVAKPRIKKKPVIDHGS